MMIHESSPSWADRSNSTRNPGGTLIDAGGVAVRGSANATLMVVTETTAAMNDTRIEKREVMEEIPRSDADTTTHHHGWMLTRGESPP